ncbi:Germin-like protein 8-2 [Ananas comosus]|uniref:Germin-like protein 8-2 n=1 Tax=Ananas comosus TaxID=4615 RepID=A0A199V854_ANACO|nr:Germin-like protein 8-2 [Ananas comosus]
MASRFLLLALFALVFSQAIASDPSPLQDFCVADKNSPVFMNGLVCKNPNFTTPEDFFFEGLDQPGNTMNKLGFNANLVNAMALPGLNTLGISLARLDFAPYGLNPPHTHPRATEVFTVVEGTFYVEQWELGHSRRRLCGGRAGDRRVRPMLGVRGSRRPAAGGDGGGGGATRARREKSSGSASFSGHGEGRDSRRSSAGSLWDRRKRMGTAGGGWGRGDASLSRTNNSLAASCCNGAAADETPRGGGDGPPELWGRRQRRPQAAAAREEGSKAPSTRAGPRWQQGGYSAVAALGAPRGNDDGPPVVGGMPRGWPRAAAAAVQGKSRMLTSA